MELLQRHIDEIWDKAGVAWLCMLALLIGLALSMNLALAQEEAGEEEDEALELSDVRVTGSRLNRPPSELSGNLIVLDQDDIRASGELTLARVLRQLPQNVNATNETYGSDFNNVENKTGAASVNLRGLGSESTLILVDGRRIGYSGIFGGVTDISTIPLSMVERIEILLDGASAVYGSDAVGGVVNIITRKDYSGVELDLNYGRPHKSGYDETRANLSTGFAWSSGRANLGYEYFRHSGLDSSLRESLIISNRSTLQTSGQKNTAPGPQIRVYSYFYDDRCDLTSSGITGPILFRLDGAILTRDEFAALDAEAQGRAACINDFTLPPGYQLGDDLNAIEIFGEPHWGDEAEIGYSLLPDQRHDVVNLGIDQNLTDTMTLHANVRFGMKDTSSEDGLNYLSAILHRDSPYNPFGTRVDLSGLAVGTPPKLFESETEELFARLGIEGTWGAWSWEAELSSSRQDIDTTRFNVRSDAYRLGVNSDGVSESLLATIRNIDEDTCAARQMDIGGTRYTHSSSFFGITCNIFGAAPEPINPFGDLNPWIIPDVDSGSKNEQTQFEALARGELFNAPGGPIALVAGYDFRQDVLDSFSDFNTFAYIGNSAPTGRTQFNTRVSRDNHAAFFEGLVPLVGSDNAMAGVQRLNLTLSGRYDSYSNVEAEYRESEGGDSGMLEDPSDPGSEFTWSAGIVYRPTDTIMLKGAFSTAFVAPQLNQLLSRVQVIEGGDGLPYFIDSEGLAAGRLFEGVIENRGGNDKLRPETADILNLSAEFSPSFLPGVFFKASWSDTEFKDRIIFLRTPTVFLDNLPSTVTYLPEEELYIVDNRWVNASFINRTGMDYELRYEWEQGLNDFSILIRRGYTNRYDVLRDAQIDTTVFDIVETRDDTGNNDVTLPPVPKHQTSAQFTWERGGLFFSLDVQGASRTRILMAPPMSELITEPATNYDLVLGYEFGDDTLFDAPAWLDGASATLTINNVTNAFARNSRVNLETGEQSHYLVNPFYEWTQGRSYRLALHKSF